MDVLNEWARFLYEPLMQDRVRRIQETNDPQYGREVAEKVHAGLQAYRRRAAAARVRADGPVARSGLGGVFLRLSARAELVPRCSTA